MTATATTGARAARAGTLPAIPAWAWWLAALAVMALTSWYHRIGTLTGYLGDADDAARLLQVREFIASGAWFDTTTMAMGGKAGMLSHWSRLIDLPLAGLITGFDWFVPTETAELLARIVWPMLILAPVVWVIYRASARVHGETAGLIALALVALCPLGLYQFVFGRIDHHNVMIACSVSAALLIWSGRFARRSWLLAGVLCGLALAIGYEALATVALIVAAVAIWGLADRRASAPALAFTTGFAGTFALAFVATTAPSRWLDIHCDAISLNMVVLALAGSGGVIAALGPLRGQSLAIRLAAAALATSMGILAFGGLEPKCLAGPMGQLPAELRAVWLEHVAESRSIAADLFAGRLEQSLGLITFFALAIAAQWRLTAESRRPREIFLLAILSGFAVLACWQYKYMSYASLAAVVPLAGYISRLPGMGDVGAGAMRLAATVLASQTVLLAASVEIDTALARPRPISEAVRSDAEACSTSAAIEELAELPAGLISAHIDVGAYIPALTHHRALSAPYHRIPEAIIANHHILASRDPAEAAAVIMREGVDYVAICRGLDDPFVNTDEWAGTLRASLVAGKAPPFLKRVPLGAPDALFRVWRVDKSALNPRP